MEAFDDETQSRILSYVPTESVLNCKLVCKRWLQLLSDRKVNLGILFSISRLRVMQLYYSDYDVIKSTKQEEADDFYDTRITKTNLPSAKEDHEEQPVLVGSCNGLVCLAVPHEGVYDPVYICNPYTSEYINLPKISNNNKSSWGKWDVVSGFGYLPLTNEYKVVRILYRADRSTIKGRVQVYTLGKGRSHSGWRNIRKIKHSLRYTEGVLANESLYWMDENSNQIVAFDLAVEIFRVLPPSPCIEFPREFISKSEVKLEPIIEDSRFRFLLIMLGGHLCLVDHPGYDTLDIWSFRKNKHPSSYDTKKRDYYHDWSWNKDYSIEWGNDGTIYDPFALTKNNEVLMWSRSNTLKCYDPATKSLNVIVDGDSSFWAFRGVLHMNTLVSLKDLQVTPKTLGVWVSERSTAILRNLARLNWASSKSTTISRKR